MKNLINLTKIYFKEMFFDIMGKNKKSQSKSLALFVILFGILALSLGFNYYTLAEVLEPVGLSFAVLPMGILTASLVLIMINTKSVGGNFYKSKDFEMLSALPIKNSTIISAKYISSILLSMVYSLATLLPAYVVYFMFCKVTVINVIVCVFSFVFIPSFSQLLCCLIGWISNAISSKMKNKNLISGIVSLIFVLLTLVVVSVMTSDTMIDLFADDFPLWLKIVMPFVYFLYFAIIKSSLLYFLAFVAVCLAYSVLAILFINLGYKKINSNLSITKTNTKKVKGELKFEKHSIFVQLLKKDAKKFFSTPIFFVNVIVGPIMAIAVPFALLGMKNELSMMVSDGSVLLILIATFMVPMFIGMSPASASLISIEGSSFKLVKSLPISHKSYLWSKITFNILLSLPFLIIGEVLIVIFLKMQANVAILMIVIGILFVYLLSLFSLFMNLMFARFDWTSVAMVVKQSKSVLFSMLASMVLTLIPFILGSSIISETFRLELFLTISMALIAVLSIVLTFIFIKKSKKLYEKLN